MERLIRVVQEYPVLYDTSHEDYAKTKVRDEIWSKIAEELNYPKGEAVKEQWRKLRDCHRDALRRQKRRRSGDATTVSKLWAYQKEMEFLLPYMTNRSISINLAENQVLDGSEDLGGSFMGLEDPENQNSSEQTEINEDTIVKKKQKLSENVSIILTETLDQLKRRSLENDGLRRFGPQHEDGLLQFFMSMYNTTMKMPPASQLRIKKKVFMAVSEEEEEIISKTFSEAATSIIVTPETSGRSQEVTPEEEYFISSDVKLFNV